MKYQYFDCRRVANANKLIRAGDFYQDTPGGSWYKCLGFVGFRMSMVHGNFARIRRPLKSKVVAKPAANKRRAATPKRRSTRT